MSAKFLYKKPRETQRERQRESEGERDRERDRERQRERGEGERETCLNHYYENFGPVIFHAISIS